MTTPATGAVPLLDSAKIRARRLELGFSERQLAAHLGLTFTPTVLRGLERGINHADLTMGEIAKLADTLALPLTELLLPSTDAQAGADSVARPPVAEGPQDRDEWIDRGVTQLGALLVELRRALPEAVAAELIDVGVDQLDELIEELAARSEHIGLTVGRTKNGVALRPNADVAGSEMTQQLWRRHLALRGLDIGQARLLSRVLHTGGLPGNASADEQVRSASLVNAGLLARTSDAAVELHPDVRFSLLLE